ncbi:hypothetical protein N0V83_001774 [Neocucurbitaria cava]|uniref:Heterokaryon incompatibility domain-containing protein n=1 Tax=Neocucurbitaria cava TaxID=798079 RepID=A0A9W8YGD4_9PLEO|nr:hypothetical protein N0V83_001774 [Neocucurbitaria cava]
MNDSYPGPAIDGTSIRLFTLKQKTDDGSFEAEMENFPFQKLSQEAIHFNAASYTWGKGRYSPSITLKFKKPPGKLPVLERLVPFLDIIWEHEDLKKKWWWIDSVCINQQDNTEKTEQIDIMPEVYTRAERVIVWLGEEKDMEWKMLEGRQEEVEVESDCTGAISFMKTLAKARAKARGREAKMQFSRKWSKGDYTDQWVEVLQLFGRNWWTRWWTLQEMLLPKHATFYVGKESITRDALNMAVFATWLCSKANGSVLKKQQFEAAWNRRRLCQWWQRSQRHTKPSKEDTQVLSHDEEGEGVSLLPILSYLGGHNTKEPQDRLYACLGLVNQRGRNVIPPRKLTHGMSVQLLYTNLVESFSEQYGSLDIICFSHIFNHYNVSNKQEDQPELPSWVPDWRAQVRSSAVPLMASQSANKDVGNCRPPRKNSGDAVYDAPGKLLRLQSNPDFCKGEDDSGVYKYLTENGVVLDSVNGLAGLQHIETYCKSKACGTGARHAIIQAKSTSAAIGEPNIELLEKICRSLALGRKDKYLGKRANRNFTSQFLFMCYACVRNIEGIDPIFQTWFAPDPVFKAWFEQNRTLQLGIHTLELAVKSIIDSDDQTLFTNLPHGFLQTRLPNTLDSDFENEDGLETFLQRFHDTVRKMSRRLMVTDRGYVGMAPCRARQGDVVAILFGCRIPLVLRRVDDQDAWQVIGEAYMDGWMNGEVETLVDSGEREIKRIRLV